MIDTLQALRLPRPRPLCRRRSGLMVVAAMACLLIVTSIVYGMLHSAVRARRQLHAERDRRQAELLLEAGADRAISRLATDASFGGDTWTLPAEAIIGSGDGRVTTEIMRAGNEGAWSLQVVAEYPLGRGFPVRRSHTFPISVPPIATQE